MAPDPTMSRTRIRPASTQDLPALLALLSAAQLSTDAVPALLERFVVACEDSHVIGAAAVEPCPDGIGLLRSVAVDAAHRGTGIAAALVAALEARERARGTRALYLFTDTAARFFAGLGYQAIDRASAPPAVRATAQFASECPASSTLMFKPL
jgi:N-acetylglutamate synthase-like GNAT family acetyltransferase